MSECVPLDETLYLSASDSLGPARARLELKATMLRTSSLVFINSPSTGGVSYPQEARSILSLWSMTRGIVHIYVFRQRREAFKLLRMIYLQFHGKICMNPLRGGELRHALGLALLLLSVAVSLW